MSSERLQKILARAGYGSRRYCEAVIQAGRVTVNGRVVDAMGSRADASQDEICVDGRPLSQENEEKLYLMLHKPSGFITSLRDPQGRRTVTELLPPVPYPVYPVGRLDLDTTGLLLFTNDGDLAFSLTHPSRKVPKIYLVQVKGHPQPPVLSALRRGVHLEDGLTAPAKVKVVEHSKKVTWLSMTIYEGRKRQVKRMLKHVGHPVVLLHRVAMGPVKLGKLPLGETRQLTSYEVYTLRKAAGMPTDDGVRAE